MPTLIQTFHGRVTALWGTATIRGADGKMHPLHLGDLVNKGDVILTSQDGIVKLTPDEGDERLAAKPADTPLDRVINGLDDLNNLPPTAAGLNGGDGAGDLTPGLRVDRISEGVTPASLQFPTDASGQRFEPLSDARPQPDQLSPNPIDADSVVIDATEEGAPVNLGLTPPTGASSAAVITVTQVPQIGQLIKADGTPVVPGAVLTPADLTGLKYVPPPTTTAPRRSATSPTR